VFKKVFSTQIPGRIQDKDIRSKRRIEKQKNKIKFQRKSQIGYNKKIFSQGGVLGIMPKYLFWKILYLNIF
jgi:hypothetical protein